MSDQHVRIQLVNLLTVGQAHMTFEEAVRDFPLDDINTCVDQVEYTFWHLLEHLRICQWDILDYMRNPSITAAVKVMRPDAADNGRVWLEVGGDDATATTLEQNWALA